MKEEVTIPARTSTSDNLDYVQAIWNFSTRKPHASPASRDKVIPGLQQYQTSSAARHRRVEPSAERSYQIFKGSRLSVSKVCTLENFASSYFQQNLSIFRMVRLLQRTIPGRSRFLRNANCAAGRARLSRMRFLGY